MPSDHELKVLANNPSHSYWFALLSALSRDPIDAANDAGLLALVLDKRAAELMATTSAQAPVQSNATSNQMSTKNVTSHWMDKQPISPGLVAASMRASSRPPN